MGLAVVLSGFWQPIFWAIIAAILFRPVMAWFETHWPGHKALSAFLVILGIVVAFLLIFLVLGLTFAFYAIAEADQTKVYRDAANGGQTGVFPITHDGAPPEPEPIFNIVMRDLIYGPPNDLGCPCTPRSNVR